MLGMSRNSLLTITSITVSTIYKTEIKINSVILSPGLAAYNCSPNSLRFLHYEHQSTLYCQYYKRKCRGIIECEGHIFDCTQMAGRSSLEDLGAELGEDFKKEELLSGLDQDLCKLEREFEELLVLSSELGTQRTTRVPRVSEGPVERAGSQRNQEEFGIKDSQDETVTRKLILDK